MTPVRAVLASGLLVGLGACQQMAAGGFGGAGTGGAPGEQLARDSACGADGLQDLVGGSVGELDPASLPGNNRVIFPGMAVTQDFQPERLNVEIGSDDRIARVYCG